jgi:hypothetical protein
MVCLTQFAVSFLAAGVVAPPVFWIIGKWQQRRKVRP